MIDYKCRERIKARIVTPPPMLTIIDDDGHIDYKDYLLPFSLEMNAPIATAVTPLRFGGQSSVGRYMTVNEIKECMNMGAEVLCHTYTHVPLNQEIRKTKVIDGHIDGRNFVDTNGNVVTPESTCVYHDTATGYYYTNENGTGYWHITNATVPNIDQLIDVYTDVGGYYDSNGDPCYADAEDYYSDKLAKYYTKAKNILLQDGFKDADILVYNNDTGDDPMALKASRRVFRCGFDINGSKLNQYGQIDRAQVHRYSIENAVNQYYGVERMKQLIDNCVRHGGWMVWTMHTTGNEWRGATSGTHTGIGKYAVMDNLREAINYAHSKGLLIVPASYGCSAYIDSIY